MAAATVKAVADRPGVSFERERELLARMTELADAARGIPDARVKHLITWARAHKDRRVLIFTEYADTKRYLEKQLRAALTPGRDSDPRIATFHGGMPRTRAKRSSAPSTRICRTSAARS